MGHRTDPKKRKPVNKYVQLTKRQRKYVTRLLNRREGKKYGIRPKRKNS